MKTKSTAQIIFHGAKIVTTAFILLSIQNCGSTNNSLPSSDFGTQSTVQTTPQNPSTQSTQPSVQTPSPIPPIQSTQALPPTPSVSGSQAGGLTTDSETAPTAANCSYWNQRQTKIENALSALANDDDKYNKLCNAITMAGLAPAGYISPNVAPGIAQGPGVTDSLNGVTVLRSDLYYAHDIAAQVRAQLDGGHSSFALPGSLTTVTSVTDALANYRAAHNALPKFAGPPGFFLGEVSNTPRFMDFIDGNEIASQLGPIQASLANCP